MNVQVRVDPDVCEGTAYCVRLLPEVFVLSGHGHAVTIEDDADDALREQLEEAERLCPVGAVILGP